MATRRRTWFNENSTCDVLTAVLAVLLLLPHLCTPFIHHPVTASVVRRRPERAALTPPTVTSYRPPDRSGRKHSAVGVTVQGEQGGSNSPPVVASRSPSRNYSGDRSRHYFVVQGRQTHPTASLATPSYRSRSAYISSGLSQGKDDGANQDDTHNFWGGSQALGQERKTVGEKDKISDAGVWGMGSPQRTTYPKGRADTYGHSIAEDLSHLQSGYSPRSRGRSSEQTSSSQSTGYPLRSRDSLSPSLSARNHPRGPQIYYPRSRSYGVESSGGTYHTSNYNRRNLNGNTPDISEGQEIWGSRFYDITEEKGIDRTSVQQNTPRFNMNDTRQTSLTEASSNPDSKKLLDIDDVVRVINMSDVDGLLETMRRKGIRLSQLLEHIDNGASEEDVLKFLDIPDIVTTTTPAPVDAQLSTTLMENEEGFASDADLFFTESIVHDVKVTETELLDETLFPGQSADEEDDDVITKETMALNTERKKNRRNRKKGKRNHGSQNKRRRGRKRNKDTTIISSMESENESENEDTGVIPLPSTSTRTSVFVATNLHTESTGIHNSTVSSVPHTTWKMPSVSTGISPSVPFSSSVKPHILATLADTLDQNDSTSVPAPELNVSSPTIEKTDSSESTITEENAVFLMPLTHSKMAITTQLPVTMGSELPGQTTTMRSILPPNTAVTVSTFSKETSESTSAVPSVMSTNSRSDLTTPVPHKTSTSSAYDDSRDKSQHHLPTSKTSEASIVSFTIMTASNNPRRKLGDETVPEHFMDVERETKWQNNPKEEHRKQKVKHRFRKDKTHRLSKPIPSSIIPHPDIKTQQQKDNYSFPIRGLLIISGIMGALGVFTLVVLISYAIIKCSKRPPINNYRVSEQKPVATQ